ncbi:MAG: HAD family hydrolase [Pseudomonadota bacterium]
MKKTRGILFDVYGTLIDILTDEGMNSLYEPLVRVLYYYGISIDYRALRDTYFSMVKRQKEASREKYPEMNIEDIWLEFLQEQKRKKNVRLTIKREGRWAEKMALLFRGLSMLRLELYRGVKETLIALALDYKLGIISDAQNLFVMHELKLLGIFDLFDAMVVSNEFGYRKPDPRIFGNCLKELGIGADNAVFVGNDMYRDIFGAKQVGMKTIFFSTQYGAKEYNNIRPDRIIQGYYELPDTIRAMS